MPATAREYDMTARAGAMGRTRERLIRAAWDRFVVRRYDDVTLADIAADAGVTVQTLLNHFGSKQGLLLATTEFFADDIAGLRGSVDAGDIDGAIDALMRQYEAFGDVNWRFVADSERHAAVRQVLDAGRAVHRNWLEDVFHSYLPASGEEREETLTALFAVTDVGTWKLLRRDLGCPPEQVRAVLRRLIASQLEGESP
jgi:AcrR family transcriptional regulator